MKTRVHGYTTAEPVTMDARTRNAEVMEHVNIFAQNIKILARELLKVYPGDAMMWRAQKRTATITALDPVFVIESVGPYLYKYREQIYAMLDNGSADSFFLENTFDSELTESVVQEKTDMVSYIIPKVKMHVRILPTAEKQVYIEMIIDMLDSYVGYLTLKLIR